MVYSLDPWHCNASWRCSSLGTVQQIRLEEGLFGSAANRASSASWSAVECCKENVTPVNSSHSLFNTYLLWICLFLWTITDFLELILFLLDCEKRNSLVVAGLVGCYYYIDELRGQWRIDIKNEKRACVLTWTWSWYYLLFLCFLVSNHCPPTDHPSNQCE